MRKPRTGFTLIELLVVMGVILILAGIVVGVQRGVYHQQSQARAKADMQAIANALETFKLRYGDYPWGGATDTSQTGSTADKNLFLVLTGQRVLKKSGGSYSMVTLPVAQKAAPLIDESQIETDSNDTYFVDPWGSPYKYYYKSNKDTEWNHTGFILMSMGPDRSDTDSSTIVDFSKGEFPENSETYYNDPSKKRFDNLIYGLEFQ
jgi:prepilin-type N-terminal cleavage/methylation domain-containing protein